MTGLLDGKIAVITGGSAGIGLAIAQRFADEGAHAVIAARRQPELDLAAGRIGRGAIGVRADASSMKDLDGLFEVVRSRYGHLDVLAANASTAQAVPLGDLTEQHVDYHLGVNIKGMAFTVQKALPLMPDGASIILTSSTDNSTGGPGRSIYSATKAAERNLVRSWLAELSGRRIRVNAISPGPTATSGLASLLEADDPGSVFAEMGKHHPGGQLTQPDEVAGAALFLASDLASGVNGIELPVDGGFAQMR